VKTPIPNSHLIFVATLCLTAQGIAQVHATEPAAADRDDSGNNPAANPTQREEGWLESHRKREANLQNGGWDILLIGDSITHGWGRQQELVREVFQGQKVLNLGQPADKTENILWRLENHSLDQIQPQLAIIMAGTNNTNGDEYTPDQIAGGVKAIIAEVRENLPRTKIILLGIFPRGSGDQRQEIKRGRTAAEMNPQWRKIDQVNKILSTFADGESVFYLNINAQFLDAAGKLPVEVMPDLLHLNAAGYKIWGTAMEPLLKELLSSPDAPELTPSDISPSTN